MKIHIRTLTVECNFIKDGLAEFNCTVTVFCKFFEFAKSFIFKNICGIRSSHSKVFLRKGVLKICIKSTGEHPYREHPYRSVISIKLQSNFIEITLQHGCFPVNVLRNFSTPFPKNTSRWLLLWNASNI